MVNWTCEDAQTISTAFEIRDRAHVAENVLHVTRHLHINCLSVERTTNTQHCTGQFARSLRTQKGGCLQIAYSQNTRSHHFNEPGPHRHDFPLLHEVEHASSQWTNCCPTTAGETKHEELAATPREEIPHNHQFPELNVIATLQTESVTHSHIVTAQNNICISQLVSQNKVAGLSAKLLIFQPERRTGRSRDRNPDIHNHTA